MFTIVLFLTSVKIIIFIIFFLLITYRKITANEVKYLRGQITADQLIDQSVHYFEQWKVSKFRKMRKNRLLQKLLDEIENQGVGDILAEVNSLEEEIILSEDSDEEEERRMGPTDPLGSVEVLETCCVCLGDGGESVLNFFSFKCGHQFCDDCCNGFFAASLIPTCAVCREPLRQADKRRMYRNNRFVVRPSQAPRPVPRVLTQDERRQENILLMAGRRLHLQDQVIEESEPETTEDEVFFASSGKYTNVNLFNMYCLYC
jgi:hypothetical protein